ncbi:MAG: hypothetical protein AB7D37_08165 [Desulfovibrio sp.]
MNRDFRPTARLRYDGDAATLAGLRGQALRELAIMDRENVFDLPVYSRVLRLPGGETIVCGRTGSLDRVDIVAPRHRSSRTGERSPLRPHPEREGEFFAIPGCLARYEGMTSLQNAVTDGELAGWSLGLGNDVTVLAPAQAGLAAPEGLPQAGIARDPGVFALPGGAASGLLFGRGHIPDNVPFSVSCLMRLREPLEYDYTYDDRGVSNPFRAYFLQSGDGSDFTWDCPGSISPVLGFCSPHLHPGWTETVTYPWSPWNTDFTTHTEELAGARCADTACPDAPLLTGDAYRDAAGHAYPYPHGFILGLQAAGLFVYNGNRLLGARLSHFESQFGFAPALTAPLEYGLWHHVVMTHDTDGTVRVYVAREDDAEASVWTGNQPLCAMDDACVYQASGVNAWTLHNGRTGAAIGAYRMNPVMDVALPRFFHYALSADQAYLLQLEGLTGLFVADDQELGQAAAAGLTPIIIPKEAS